MDANIKGCGSHSCRIAKPQGMGTNGPCTCWQRVVPLIKALSLCVTACTSSRTMLEDISDGQSVPSLDTIQRHHDLLTDAITTAELLGVDPQLSDGPDDGF